MATETLAMPTATELAQHNFHAHTVRLGCLLEQIDTLVDTAIDEDGERGKVMMHAARELIALATAEVSAMQTPPRREG